jgi:predicted ATPase
MLKAIELENFKAFGERNRIELAPITLIFGENSAGKSSILQALNLLKQTRENRDHGVLLLPRTEGGIVDLGGFKELLFDHDLQRELSIRIDMIPDVFSRRRPSEAISDQSNGQEYQGFEVTFARPSEDAEIELRSLTIHGTAALGRAAEFRPTHLESGRSRPFAHDPSVMTRSSGSIRTSDVKGARCTWLTEERYFWCDIYARSKRRAEKIVDELRQLRSDAHESARQVSLFEEVEGEKRSWLGEIDEAITFYESDFSIDAFIKRMLQAELQTVIGLDGFIPILLRQRERERLPELETFRRFGPTRLRMRDLTLDLSGFAVDCGRTFDSALESLYPMGPYRRAPQRWYIFTGTSPQDVGYSGDLLPDLLFRRPELVQETNGWLDKLEMGYHIKVQSVGIRSRDLFEVRLIDKRRGREVDVALSDVGFGVSQILPFIVQSLAGERQTITIEQPEVHIHPRLQADIGDLLAAAILPPRLHRFIIETHSEHLVLRMQRLVRDGRLQPDEVSIIYVSRGTDGSRAQRLRLDSSGDFIDDWPGGFFPERLRELM